MDRPTKIEIQGKDQFSSTAAEVSTVLTLRRSASLDDGDIGILLAKRSVDRELDGYFPQIHPYITRIEATILRERYRDRGLQTYLMRVYVTCPLHVVQEFHKVAGVQVEIPQEEIRYKPG